MVIRVAYIAFDSVRLVFGIKLYVFAFFSNKTDLRKKFFQDL